MNLLDKNVLVLGAGRSGIAAAELVRRLGGSASVVDASAKSGVDFAGDKLPEGDFSLAVVSPSIPMEHAWLAECAARRIAVEAELQFARRFWNGATLSVTGSKGKSSVVKLIADTFNLAGRSASPAGNYGIPLCSLCLEEPRKEVAVVEASSFQMEHTSALASDAAIFLNLQADHLDRHITMEEYARQKFKVVQQVKPGAPVFLPEGLQAPETVGQVFSFGIGAGSDCRWSAGKIDLSERFRKSAVFGGEELSVRRISLECSWFDNEVYGPHAAAAVGAMLAQGLSASIIEQGLTSFEPLKHRMQSLGTDARGVEWIDDSKATSLTATAAALKMTKKPVRLVAGGILKENNLSCIKELLAKRVQKVYLIGRCAEQMAQAWSDAVPCEVCGAMDAAVKLASSEATGGEVVLLSPGTASFDQFASYQARGESFAEHACGCAGPLKRLSGGGE